MKHTLESIHARCIPAEGDCLIAAAPELLHALRYIEGLAMADEPRDLPTIAQAAREAIAKATGEKNEH